MNPTFTIALKRLGLSETESAIYLAGLGAPSLGVSALVKKTGINRTTAYHALGTLMEKGLVAKKGAGNKLAFTMTKPSAINALLDDRMRLLVKQKEELTAIIPLLNQHLETDGGAVNVLHYEGVEGVKFAVEDALYCQTRHWDILSPIKNFFSDIDKSYAEYFIKTRQARGITSRSLWEPKKSHAQLTVAQIKERNPRILPPIMHGKFHTVICLYDNKVLVISSLSELYAIIIQSKEFHKTMSALYDGLWSVSQEIKLRK